MNRRKPLVILLSIILVLALGFFLFTRYYLNPSLDSNQEEVRHDEVIVDENENYDEYIKLWDDNYEINSDYVGQLWFESGLINQPVVQANNNDKYYRTDWKTMKHFEEGSVFADYRNDLKLDQNIIIYGHNVEKSYEPSMTHMFTPLHQLETKQGVQDNKYVYLLLKDRLLKYEVCLVYKAKQYQEYGENIYYKDAPKFFEPNYTHEQFDIFLAAAKKNKISDYEALIDYNDSMLTLQTCIEGSIDKFVVTCKLIETKYIRRK